MPSQHALLSASSSSRWINCPPSARLAEQFENKTSEYAAQGTDAHSLCEYKLQKLLGNELEYPELQYYDEEMEECSEAYATYIMEEVAKVKSSTADPVVIVEQRLDFSRYVPEGFGTGDCLIIADGRLSVIDLKYGAGILVEAHENSQMMCYALGALELFDGIYDIKEVKMTIFQPRRESISTYTLSKSELFAWAEEFLSPAAELAFAGEGDYHAGSWCRFCKAKNVCKARVEQNLELAKHEFKPPNLLTDEEIEEVLSKVDELVAWSTNVKDYAVQQALSGKQWNNWKLVYGRSTRKYADEDLVAKVVTQAGFEPYEQKLLSITAMSKLLGKKMFDEILDGLIDKPRGKLTLVPNDDKHQGVQVKNAQNEFNDITEEN
ncbi:DUF2800 domain-containing protein [Listeria monocytogenes]|nr:DUF2800 domain-containing protein [Listeria monocytogenes]